MNLKRFSLLLACSLAFSSFSTKAEESVNDYATDIEGDENLKPMSTLPADEQKTKDELDDILNRRTNVVVKFYQGNTKAGHPEYDPTATTNDLHSMNMVAVEARVLNEVIRTVNNVQITRAQALTKDVTDPSTGATTTVRLADDATRVTFVSINARDNMNFANLHDVKDTPTYLFFKNGKEYTSLRLVGEKTADVLEGRMQKLIDGQNSL